MNSYRIKTIQPYTARRFYRIEAESEEKAKELFLQRMEEIDPYCSRTDPFTQEEIIVECRLIEDE